MRTVGFLFLAIISFITPAKADVRPRVIKMDQGGWIQDYLTTAERYSKEGRKVVVDGDCRSACTLFLYSKFNLDICATRNARFMFHMPLWRIRPNEEGRHNVIVSPERAKWSEGRWSEQLKGYPPALAEKIREVPNPSVIGDTQVYKILRASDLAGIVKPCEPSPAM